MKEVIIGIAAIVLLAFAIYQKPMIVDPMGSQESTVDSKLESHKAHTHSQTKATSRAINNLNEHTKRPPSGNAHLDQLSPEMKQSLRETLLFNAPIETIKRPDGSVIMNTNGRVTHMPVAVQMPDGSIQIKEYSYIPDDN